MQARVSRRSFIRSVGASSLALSSSAVLSAPAPVPLRKTIPAGGEAIAVIGMGSSQTFDVAPGSDRLPQLLEVLQRFFDLGGQLVDTSPMYGNAESVLGTLLPRVQGRRNLFLATKVWTDGRQAGIGQMQTSMARLGAGTIDLMQVHNLRDWRVHLATLREWKAQGRIRYLGITTSHGREHEVLAGIMRTEPLDFVQFSYSIGAREVERDLLPIAADRGIATLVNRPFQRGELFARVRGAPLPEWATEFDCASWGQFFLKYVVSHPAVTCAIPATSRVGHMLDNMGAGFGRLPDAALRGRMERFFATLS